MLPEALPFLKPKAYLASSSFGFSVTYFSRNTLAWPSSPASIIAIACGKGTTGLPNSTNTIRAAFMQRHKYVALNRRDDFACRIAHIRPSAAQQFIQGDAQRIDVGALIYTITTSLLWGHVWGRTTDSRHQCTFSGVLEARQPEVREFYLVLLLVETAVEK